MVDSVKWPLFLDAHFARLCMHDLAKVPCHSLSSPSIWAHDTVDVCTLIWFLLDNIYTTMFVGYRQCSQSTYDVSIPMCIGYLRCSKVMLYVVRVMCEGHGRCYHSTFDIGLPMFVRFGKRQQRISNVDWQFFVAQRHF